MKVYKFSAEWCGPCKVMRPIFEKITTLNEFNDIKFQECDVEDENVSDLVTKYNIRNVPTLIFTDDNDVQIDKIVGSRTESELITFIRNLVSSTSTK